RPKAKAVKIGWARNLKLRISQHQCGCPFDLKLIGTIAGDARLEQRIHRVLAPERVRGEWFASKAARSFYKDCLDAGVESAIAERALDLGEIRKTVQKRTEETMAFIERIAPGLILSDRPRGRRVTDELMNNLSFRTAVFGFLYADDETCRRVNETLNKREAARREDSECGPAIGPTER